MDVTVVDVARPFRLADIAMHLSPGTRKPFLDPSQLAEELFDLFGIASVIEKLPGDERQRKKRFI